MLHVASMVDLIHRYPKVATYGTHNSAGDPLVEVLLVDLPDPLLELCHVCLVCEADEI